MFLSISELVHLYDSFLCLPISRYAKGKILIMFALHQHQCSCITVKDLTAI